MDRIDERNRREKIAKSIIKRQNVHYITQEELDIQRAEEEAKRAREVCERLQTETDSEEEIKQEDLLEIMQNPYNAGNRPLSEEYGKQKPEDEVTLGQIEKILTEKENEFMKTLKESLEQSPDE